MMSNDMYVNVVKAEKRLMDLILMNYGNEHTVDERLKMMDDIIVLSKHLIDSSIMESRRLIKEDKDNE